MSDSDQRAIFNTAWNNLGPATTEGGCTAPATPVRGGGLSGAADLQQELRCFAFPPLADPPQGCSPYTQGGQKAGLALIYNCGESSCGLGSFGACCCDYAAHTGCDIKNMTAPPGPGLLCEDSCCCVAETAACDGGYSADYRSVWRRAPPHPPLRPAQSSPPRPGCGETLVTMFNSVRTEVGAASLVFNLTELLGIVAAVMYRSRVRPLARPSGTRAPPER